MEPRTVHITPSARAWATLAVLVGSALLGIAGAILAVPLAASLRIVASELAAPRQRRLALTPSTKGSP